MSPQIPAPPASSSASAQVIDLQPESSAILLTWWVTVHALAGAAIVVLGAPLLPKVLALWVVLVHALALVPERTPRVVYRTGGRVAVPELGLVDLTLGPRTRCTTGWVRFDLRGAGRALDLLVLADQVEPAVWWALQAELRQIRPNAGNAAAVK